MNYREELLAEAKHIVCGARNKAYGNPEDNFQNIADLWNAYMRKKPIGLHNGLFSSMDVTVLMMLVKVARLKTNSTHRDSLVDIAGYAACGADIQASLNAKPDKPQTVRDIVAEQTAAVSAGYPTVERRQG